jgi:hypothetical protein
MAINPIKILDEVLQGVSLTLNVSAIVDNGGGSYTLTVDNTYYLNRLSTITIDAVEYTVTDFTINTELVVSGDSLPTATSFTINQPLFLYGNPQMVSAEIVKRQENGTLTYPYIWAVEISTTSKNLNPSAAVKATKSFNLFFFDTVDRENWVIEDHYNQDIYPLSNYIDYFFAILKSRRDLFDSDSITWNETNHVNFGDYIQDQGNREKILNDNITGIQVQAEVPFMAQGCGFTSVTKNCLPVSVTFNGLSVTPTTSGGVKNVVVVNDAVPSVQVGSVTLDNENNLNIQVPASGGGPVDTDFNGTPTGVDTPAGDNLDINVVDLLDNPIGTLTTNTANEKKIEVDTTCDPVSTSMNGAGLTDTPAGETKAFTIRYEDDSPVTVTTITDTANSFEGTVPNCTTPSVRFYRPVFEWHTSYNSFDEGYKYLNNVDPYNDNTPTGSIIQRLDPDNLYKIVEDDSATTGISTHLFRYYNPTTLGYFDGTDFRDSSGNLSDKATEFTTDGDLYLVDRLTGYGWFLNYSLTGDTFQNTLTTINGLTRCGFSDLWAPTLRELLTIFYFGESVGSTLLKEQLSREPFVFASGSILYRSSSPNKNSPTTRSWVLDQFIEGRVLNGNYTATNNYTPVMRYHFT